MQTIKTIHNSLKSNFICIIIYTFNLLFIQASMAQEFNCANEVFQSLQFNDSAFIQQLRTLNQFTNPQRINGTILEIPVVVHVLHLGEAIGTGSNISDQQIYDAIKGANERWRKINSSEGVDMEVEFCLAQFDPFGNPSSGIIRKDASIMPAYREIGIGYIEAILSGEFGSDEIQTKNLSNWPHHYVYNIWVVHKIAGGWGGYAYFPLPNGEYSTDGTVILASAMRYSSSTLAHELGHGMGLFHTFQGSENGCPANDLCFIQGDWICDTPPHKKTECTNSICNNSPDSLFSFRNIMSYCGGRGLFTQGQKDRARTTIFNSSRNLLLQSTACTGFPCDTARTKIIRESCIASDAGIQYDTLQTTLGCDSIIETITTLVPRTNALFSYQINGTTLTFNNNSQHAHSYIWIFGDNTSDTSTSPIHTYLGSGVYTVKLIALNACHSDTETVLINFTSTHLNLLDNTPKLTAYPNPNSGSFMFFTEVKHREIVFAELINHSGQIIKKQQLNVGKTHYFETSENLLKGVYQLLLKKNNEVISSCTISIF